VAWTMGRVGARWMIVAGTVVVAIGAVLIARLVYSGWAFVTTFGVVIGTGMACSAVIAPQFILTQWFLRKRALVISLLMLSVSGGGAVAAPLLASVVAKHGWRAGWWLIGAFATVAAVAAALLVRNEPADIGQLPDGMVAGRIESEENIRPSRVHQTRSEWSLRGAVRTSSFWAIAICSTVSSAPLMVMLAHLGAHLKDLGFTPGVAASTLTLFGAAQVAGTVVLGVLGDRIEPRYLWAGAMASIGFGLLVALVAHTQILVYAFALLLGVGLGVTLVAIPTLLGNYFGSSSFAKISGMQTAIFIVPVSVSPYLAGLSYEITGNYALAFSIMALLVITGSVVIFFTEPPGDADAAEQRAEKLSATG
jgi:MFS family permease